MDYETTDSGLPGGGSILEHPEMPSYIKQTKTWAKFLGILGFIFCGLIVLAALSMFALGSTFYQQLGDYSNMAGPVLGVAYLIIAALYVVPSLHLYKCAQHLGSVTESGNPQEFIKAFGRIKSLFKFWGILAVVTVAFYFLALLGGVIGGFGTAF